VQFERMLCELGLTESAETVQPGWEESRQSLPAGEIEFLSAEFVRAACAEFGVTAEDAESTVATARRIAEHPALRAFAWHCHRVFYGSGTPDWMRTRHWPAPEAALGTEAGIFCTLTFLSGLPGMHAQHAAHDIPPQVVRDTLSDVDLGLEVGKQGRRRGMQPDDVEWYSGFLRAELYRLGRLQFQRGRFGHNLRAFRHAASGAVLALVEHGVRFRTDGQLARKGDADGLWTATLEVSEAGAVGYPILPTGQAVPRLISLPATEWRQVLAPDDPVLHIHIPGGWPDGTPMSYDACGESLGTAMAFFPRHYPDYQFRGSCCGSWVLNTWFAEVLPPTSNMRRFQEEMYLFPAWIDPQYLIETAFHELPGDLSQAPRDTTLQRAILGVLESGRTLEAGGGGCFLLRDDLRWGAQVYRNQHLPIRLP